MTATTPAPAVVATTEALAAKSSSSEAEKEAAKDLKIDPAQQSQ